MDPNATTDEVRDIMIAFADRTGLSSDDGPPRRYLWTDAFAVCNFLTLYRRTGEGAYRRLALDLVEQVHTNLGRHRDDDPRTGWISGLDEAAGARHPTAGGLRIGKALNERAPDERYDERTEWDRDGQYLHYLTKWMHALERTAEVTEDPTYLRWAMELAKAAHAGFSHGPAGGGVGRLYWKMSIDLSRPLVPSTGLHDPLDAFVTYSELRLSARSLPGEAEMPGLDREITETAAMCEGRRWDTDDPLGIGGLLFDAWRAALMTARDDFEAPGLLEALLGSSRRGLDDYLGQAPLSLPLGYRLAFRELGLSIGLRAVERMREVMAGSRSRFGERQLRELGNLVQYLPLAETIEGFWRDSARQESAGWRAHGDINAVMLATSLAPEQFLSL